MLLITPLIIIQSQQKTQTRSLAAYQEAACNNPPNNGECQGGFSGDRSTDEGSGCNLSDGRGGHAIIGACPNQDETVRCCVPNGGGQSQDNDQSGGDDNPTNNSQNDNNQTQGGNDDACTQRMGGDCQWDATDGASCNDGSGTFQSGYCGSNPSSSYLCCVPNNSSDGDNNSSDEDNNHTTPNNNNNNNNQASCNDYQNEESCPYSSCYWNGTSCVEPKAQPKPADDDCGNACEIRGASANLNVSLEGIEPNTRIQNPKQTATVKIYESTDAKGAAKYSSTDSITYDPQSGNFINTNFNLGKIPEGKYKIILQIDKYLDTQVRSKNGDTVLTLSSSGKLETSPVSMNTGDVAPTPHGDNFVDILDYNSLTGCMQSSSSDTCVDKKLADLNDDGSVDQKDLDMLKDNFGQNGFSFEASTFTCVPDPTCSVGKNSLQMCALKCTKQGQRS